MWGRGGVRCGGGVELAEDGSFRGKGNVRMLVWVSVSARQLTYRT